MVRSVIAIGFSSVLTAVPVAAASDVEAGASQLPAIAEVTIIENAARSPAASKSDESCTEFVLTKRDVLNFLTRADEISEHDYHHLLDWSPCYVAGKVKFRDGQTAMWGIHRYRGGSIKFKDGQTHYLTCPKCHAKAFSSTR